MVKKKAKIQKLEKPRKQLAVRLDDHTATLFRIYLAGRGLTAQEVLEAHIKDVLAKSRKGNGGHGRKG